MAISRNALKLIAAQLASAFDTMPDDLWEETLEVSPRIEMALPVYDKTTDTVFKFYLIIERDCDDEPFAVLDGVVLTPKIHST